MDVDYDKLLQAIELVVYNRLDECRDDTLIEKLITVFDRSFNGDLKCSDQQLNAIFDLCRRSVDRWADEDRCKVFIGPVFSFIFKLISSPGVQLVVGRQPVVAQAKRLIDLKNEVFTNCDYSIQSYYVKGLTKLFASKTASKLAFEEALITERFVKSLIDLGVDSKSFFVKEAIQQCLVEILTRTCEADDDAIASKYFKLVVSSFELRLNKFQIKIIGPLLAKEKRTVLRLFPDLFHLLMGHINGHADENVNIQLIELLAAHLDDEAQISFVFTKLVKNKLLKVLIAFSAHLAARNAVYLNKWLTFVVLPLQIDADNDTTIDATTDTTSGTKQNNGTQQNGTVKRQTSSCFSCSQFDEDFVRSLTDERSLIYCLHHLKINFPKCLSDEQLSQVLEIIDRFVRQLIKQSKMKLLRESLLMIGSICKRIDQSVGPKLFAVLVDLLISLLWSESFHCECLIWLRHLFERHDLQNGELVRDAEIRTKLINLLDQILNLELKDDNLDTIDGGLELLGALVKNCGLDLSELSDSTLQSIFRIWSYSTEHSYNYALKASCISILLNIRLQLDAPAIDRLLSGSIDKSDKSACPTDLTEIIWKCLKDENSLVRRKAVDSIREAVLDCDRLKDSALDQLMADSGRLCSGLFYHVSESVLFDIDADIQLASINLLLNLLVDLLNSEQVTEKTTTFRGLLCFVHCLHFTAINHLICFTVKEECLNALQTIRDCLQASSISKNDLLTILGDESVFEYQVNGHGQAENGVQRSKEDLQQDRDEQLNEMFKDNVFRTEEIIAQFTKKRVEQMQQNGGLPANESPARTLITNRMNADSLLEFLYTFDPKSILGNKIKVDFLDDILAAQANDDVIIDCY